MILVSGSSVGRASLSGAFPLWESVWPQLEASEVNDVRIKPKKVHPIQGQLVSYVGCRDEI